MKLEQVVLMFFTVLLSLVPSSLPVRVLGYLGRHGVEREYLHFTLCGLTGKKYRHLWVGNTVLTSLSAVFLVLFEGFDLRFGPGLPEGPYREPRRAPLRILGNRTLGLLR